MIRWRDLLDRLDQAGLLRATLEHVDTTDDPVIDHLAHDSRAVGPGGLFVAIRGEKTDGHLFIDKAVQHGAIAILCEAMPEEIDAPGIACAQVTNTRAALAEAAAAFYGDPSHALRLIGVTGTNGKTTTAFLIYHLLMTLGVPTGLIGTVAYRIGEATQEPTHTTPDAIGVQRLFQEMVEAGCTACAMEVSSHALDQDRVRSAAFDVGVFTNLTQEHLDYHETFEGYLAAKKRLFDMLPATATALYNTDDPSGTRMVADTRARRVSYGQAADADLCLEVLDNALSGLRLRLDGRERTFRLVGRFNAYNLAAAYGAGRALGYDAEALLDVLAEAPPVPGRFEQIAFTDGTTAIVDYAHTPDALENVLVTIRETMPANAALWCVFGCGGARDRMKRPHMGALAEQYADHVIVTSDNPRTEPPEQILDDIRDGMTHPESAAWIVDRAAAIEAAAHRAAAGDVVLVAGKGHETYQVIGDEKRPFDDREVVRHTFSDVRGTSYDANHEPDSDVNGGP
jgi:UDP-N-acetylmuramoyl-L-alanyl-D-glutamate--2,6-diaminopimelate ligase